MNKTNIQNLSENFFELTMDGESPLERWLNLDNKSITELYIFHIAYCWMFLKDNELIEPTDDSIKYFIVQSYMAINKLAPGLEIDDFVELYFDRYKKFSEELLKVRAKHHLPNPYHPNYFYSRVCKFPLLNNDISNYKFEHDDWKDDELADMFAHQINFLEDNLKKML